MIAVKEICALLLAGSMGAGSVVAVQQARPAVKRVKAAKPVPKPRLAQATRPAHTSALADCPTVAALSGGVPQLSAIPPFETSGMGAFTGGGASASASLPGGGLGIPPVLGGGSGGGQILPPGPAPAVPEPAAWAMMVSGFGLIGLAMRRTRGTRAAGGQEQA